MSELPPEDQPPNPLFVPSSSEEVIAGMGDLTPDNPMTAAFALYGNILNGDIEAAKLWVTPESLLELG